MIPVVEIFNALCQSVPDYKSGVNPMPEFNTKLNESQKEIMDYIAPQYDRNERIRTLLDPFVNTSTGTSSGTIAKPTGFYRTLGITVVSSSKTIPLYQAKENELISQDFIPQRKADFSRGIGYYKQAGLSITVIPSTAVPYEMYYLREPIDANLEFAYTTLVSDELALAPTSVVDLEWNDSAFNLIMNWLLRKYGLITREQFYTQLGAMGIQQDLINQA